MDDFEEQKESLFDLINSWDEKNIRLATLICNNFPKLQETALNSFEGLLNVKGYKKSFAGLRLLSNLNVINSDDLEKNVQYLSKIRWLQINHADFSLFPAIYLRDLLQLKISSNSLMELPESIAQLKSLQVLDLENCRNLRQLPAAIQQLDKLTFLNLKGTLIGEKYGYTILDNNSKLLEFFRQL